MILSGVLCAINMSIFYADIKARRIYLVQLLLLLTTSVVIFFQSGQQPTDLLIKLGWVVSQVTFLAIYSRLALKRSLFKGFGMGDLLLLLAIIPLFAPLTFIAFYITGLLFSLLASVLFFHGKSIATFRIPLAGLLCLWMIPFLFLESKLEPLLLSLIQIY